MDPGHALDSRLQPSAWDIANTVIVDMGNRLKMASQWIEFLIRLHRYFQKKRAEWKAAGGSPRSTTSDGGGGLKDYSELFESDQKEFGSLANKSWSSRTFNQDDLKLQHDPESEERSAAPSPIAFKSEGTPASGLSAPTRFNPVNRPGEAELTSEALQQTPQIQALHISGPRLSTSSIHPSPAPHSPYGTQRVQSVQSPMDESTAAATNYYSSSELHGRILQTSQDMYPIQHSATGAGTSHYGPSAPWQQQRGPGPQLDLQTISNLELEGQSSMGSTDIMDMQWGAQNSIGDVNTFFGNYMSHGPGQMPQSHGHVVSWDGSSYDPMYPNMNMR